MEDRALGNHNYWHFLKEIHGRERADDAARVPVRMEMLSAMIALILLSLPVICFINVVFQDQPPAVRGNKLNMHKKKEFNGKVQSGPQKAFMCALIMVKHRLVCWVRALALLCWMTGRINIWPLMHFFEGIKKVKGSIIYSSSAGNRVRPAPSVRAAASHFV